MNEKKPYLYIYAKSFQQFQEEQKHRPHFNCIYIVDGTTLSGRTNGQIIILEGVESNWNYLDVLESIDRFRSINEETESTPQSKNNDIYGI